MVVKYVDCTKAGKPEERRIESVEALWKKAIEEEWLVLHRKKSNVDKGQEAWIAFAYKDPAPPKELKHGFISVTGLDRAGESLLKVVREELARRKELVKEVNVKSPVRVTAVIDGKEETRNTSAFLRQSLQQGWVLSQGEKLWCPFLFGWEDLPQHLDGKIVSSGFSVDTRLLTDLLRRRFPGLNKTLPSTTVTEDTTAPDKCVPSSTTAPHLSSLSTVPDKTTADETLPPPTEMTRLVENTTASTSQDETPSETTASTPQVIATTKDQSFETSTITEEASHKENVNTEAWTTHDFVKHLYWKFEKFEKNIDKLDKIEKRLNRLDKIDKRLNTLVKTASKLVEHAVKNSMVSFFEQEFPSYRCIHPVKSAKVIYTPDGPLEDLAKRLLKCVGKDESGKNILKTRVTPTQAEIDIKMQIIRAEKGQKSEKCILVELSKSPELYTKKFEYPKNAASGPSTKFLYKLIQLERGILATQSQSALSVVGAAIVNSPSFEGKTDDDLKALLRSIMQSPARNVLPNLLRLYNQRHLYLLPV